MPPISAEELMTCVPFSYNALRDIKRALVFFTKRNASQIIYIFKVLQGRAGLTEKGENSSQ